MQVFRIPPEEMNPEGANINEQGEIVDIPTSTTSTTIIPSAVVKTTNAPVSNTPAPPTFDKTNAVSKLKPLSNFDYNPPREKFHFELD